MAFQSALDLYFSVLGMQVYAIIWNVFVETGVVYLPIALVFLKEIKNVSESRWEGIDTSSGIKSVTVSLSLLVITLVVFAIPSKEFEVTDVKYFGRMCMGTTPELGKVEDESAYGYAHRELFLKSKIQTVLVNGVSIRVPLGLYMVLAYSRGASNQVVSDMPCTLNIRLAIETLNNVKIVDPELRDEAKRFFNTCFVPAREKYMTGHTWDNSLVWPGSKSLINTSGYYDNSGNSGFYSKTAMKGFGASSNKIPEADAYPPAVDIGFPTCKEWWTGSTSTGTPYVHSTGLSTKLWDVANDFIPTGNITPFADTITLLHSNHGGYDVDYIDNTKDAIVHEAFFSGTKLNQYSPSTDYIAADGNIDVADVFGRIVGGVGALFKTPEALATASLVTLLAPMGKSLIEMVLILSFAPFLLYSGFSLPKAGAYLASLSSMALWPVFFELASIVDDTILSAIGASSVADMTTSIFTQWLAWGLYVVAPSIASAALSIAGVAAVNKGLERTVTSNASNAGKAGVKAAKDGANAVRKRGKK